MIALLHTFFRFLRAFSVTCTSYLHENMAPQTNSAGEVVFATSVAQFKLVHPRSSFLLEPHLSFPDSDPTTSGAANRVPLDLLQDVELVAFTLLLTLTSIIRII